MTALQSLTVLLHSLRIAKLRYLPTSINSLCNLKYLSIEESPELSKSCETGTGKGWPRASNPLIYLYLPINMEGDIVDPEFNGPEIQLLDLESAMLVIDCNLSHSMVFWFAF
ncbi:hypothetical protein PIB30_084134 [Stylosanthes scabra]|uniref:Uncharacterized protein n=1 Tax=Stylosanthes scabra TaxID=79078 RepID=A0ABU6STW2_9FABA|nr:hypothetical protein [Stylosanthes scabra]